MNETPEKTEPAKVRARQVWFPKTFTALKHRNYQLYFGGQLISVAGTWVQIIAQGWLVYQLSHSDLILGITGFASAIPALLVTPWGGVVVDRVHKRSLLVITQASAMLLALVLAGLTFTNTVQVWHVIFLSACLGLVNAFDGPARQAFVVDMVGRESLTNAIALNSMLFNSARIIGPAMGGLLLAAVGPSWCFLINGASFLAVIAALLAMRLPEFHQSRKVASSWKQLSEGLHYIRRSGEILPLLLVALVFSTFGLAYSALLPAFVDQALHAGPAGFGAINAATGVGAVSGALAVATFGERSQKGRWLFRANMMFPLVLLVFAYTAVLPLSLLLAAGLGLGFMLEFTMLNTLLQTRVEDAMRGRVLSLYTLTFFGFAPFGNLIIGSAAEMWGLRQTIGASAVLTGILSLLIYLKAPQLLKL